MESTSIYTCAAGRPGHPHEALFWREATWSNDARVVRRGDMKLVQYSDSAPALYDLSSYVGERQDLLENDMDTAKAMTALWNEWNEGNTKASLITVTADYRYQFGEWMKGHQARRESWAEDQDRQHMTIADGAGRLTASAVGVPESPQRLQHLHLRVAPERGAAARLRSPYSAKPCIRDKQGRD